MSCGSQCKVPWIDFGFCLCEELVVVTMVNTARMIIASDELENFVHHLSTSEERRPGPDVLMKESHDVVDCLGNSDPVRM